MAPGRTASAESARAETRETRDRRSESGTEQRLAELCGQFQEERIRNLQTDRKITELVESLTFPFRQ